MAKTQLPIDCTFDKKETLDQAIKRIQNESEISVRKGLTQLILSDKNVCEERLAIPMLLSVGASKYSSY